MPITFPVKGISVFKDHYYNLGWTETIYLTNTTSLQKCSDDLKELNALRVQLLGAGITLDYTSVSQDSDKQLGDVVATEGLKPTSVAPFVYNKDYSGENADFGWSAVLCRASADSQYHRQLWLSGAPDSVQLDDQGKITDPNWVAAWKKWKLTLIDTRFGIKAFSKDLTDSPIRDIVGVGVGAGGDGQFIFKINHGYSVGDKIFVHGVHGDPNDKRPHGEYQVKKVVDAQTVTVTKYDATMFNYTKGGYARIRFVRVFPIDDVINRSIRKKSRGRPLFLQRGRSRA